MPKWGIKHYWNVTLSLSMIKSHQPLLETHILPFHTFIPTSLPLYSTVSFTLSQRSIWPDKMMAGFPKGRWVATVACHLAIISLFQVFPLRLSSWFLKIKKWIQKHTILPVNVWPFQKTQPAFWLLGDFRCNTMQSWCAIHINTFKA